MSFLDDNYHNQFILARKDALKLDYCPRCLGTGELRVGYNRIITCPICNGSKKYPTSEEKIIAAHRFEMDYLTPEEIDQWLNEIDEQPFKL